MTTRYLPLMFYYFGKWDSPNGTFYWWIKHFHKKTLGLDPMTYKSTAQYSTDCIMDNLQWTNENISTKRNDLARKDYSLTNQFNKDSRYLHKVMHANTYSVSFFTVVVLGADTAADDLDTRGVIRSLRKSSLVSGWRFLGKKTSNKLRIPISNIH